MRESWPHRCGNRGHQGEVRHSILGLLIATAQEGVKGNIINIYMCINTTDKYIGGSSTFHIGFADSDSSRRDEGQYNYYIYMCINTTDKYIGYI